MRCILDANVIISGLLSRQSASAALLLALDAGQIEVLMSPNLIREVTDVLARPRLRAKAAVARAFEQVTANARRVQDEPGVRFDADPKDAYLLSLAIRHDAVLVTFDRAVLQAHAPALRTAQPSEILNQLRRSGQ